MGRTLIGAGTLVLLFVAYQLWGTGLQEARAQDDLRDEFADTLAADAADTLNAPSAGSTTTTIAPPPPPTGAAVALVRIPAIGLDKAIVEGVGVSDLKKGPGHYPGTPMPGQPGNAAIAGHRTTYGAPFYRFDELDVGDEILVTTRQGEFRYVVDRTQVVSPDRFDVLASTAESRLTLTTCNPRYSRSQRLVVSATLRGPAAPAPTPSTTPSDPSAPAPAPLAIGEDPAGLSGDPAARGPAVTWGVGAANLAIFIWLVGRRWRRWPAYLIGVVPFAAVLFVFFENVSRLLPANF